LDARWFSIKRKGLERYSVGSLGSVNRLAGAFGLSLDRRGKDSDEKGYCYNSADHASPDKLLSGHYFVR